MTDQWRPVPGSDGYQINQALDIRSVKRVIIRRNGVPYRVRECLLTPTVDRWGTRYVRLATGQARSRYDPVSCRDESAGRRGRYHTLYLNHRTMAQLFGVDGHPPQVGTKRTMTDDDHGTDETDRQAFGT